jgi:3D (Asp-Asp-Asp) domain-containing protein
MPESRSNFGGRAEMKKTILGSGVFALAAFSVAALFIPSSSVAIGLQEQERKAKPVQETAVETTTTATTTAPAETAKAEAADAKKAEGKAETKSVPAGPSRAFTATCYSLRGRTASGAYVRKGIIAADPRVLPLGTRVYLNAGNLSGEYVVADTGGAIKGRIVDIWVPSTGQAMSFGRRKIQLTVLSGRRNSGATAKAKNAQSAGNRK